MKVPDFGDLSQTAGSIIKKKLQYALTYFKFKLHAQNPLVHVKYNKLETEKHAKKKN